MANAIKTISLPFPFNTGMVNCYLVETPAGFILIDTGGVRNRKELFKELEDAGCMPGSLPLVLITHGDFDHIGNAAALRRTFGSRIAMGAADLGMAEAGDMFAGRTRPNKIVSSLVPLFARLKVEDRFTPDVLLDDGRDLAEFGFDARVVTIPGHSKGSLGYITADGDLFCGDLFENTKKPAINSLIDDLPVAQSSLEKLEKMNIRLVYPGHGGPFMLDQVSRPPGLPGNT